MRTPICANTRYQIAERYKQIVCELRLRYVQLLHLQGRRCDASAWNGAVLRPLSLLNIYSISGESVLGRRQIGAALRIPAPDFITQTAELGERC